ncbi:MAG: hypothetical protein Tsb009_15040 [Planctomycetaceae bacterium]
MVLQLKGTTKTQLFRFTAFSFLVCVFTAIAPASSAEKPLHLQINELLSQKEFGPLSSKCDDASFLRRTTLALTGTIPSATTTRQFLADTSPDKRQKLVDRLLNSPEYLRHITNFLDVTFRERRDSKPISAAAWRDYLYRSVATNKPYHQLAREILTGHHADANLQAAGKFYFDRNAEPNQLTRDVGRIFFGKDLQCAQCHDHPIIDNYRQADYYGLYAFLNRTYVFTDKKKKKTFLAEKAEGIVNFKSVFTNAGGRTLPRLPGGREMADEPIFPQGVGYVTTSSGGPQSPRHSRRETLATRATSSGNHAFNRNIANRLWRMLMGRGLVEPVDYLHPDNPPVYPELLDLLAVSFEKDGYDIKAFLREIALSDVYQRSFDLPKHLTGDAQVLAKLLGNLKSQHEKRKATLKKSEQRVVEIEAKLKPLKDAASKIEDELAKANAAIAAAEKKAAPTRKVVDSITAQLRQKQAALASLSTAEKQIAAVAKQLSGDKDIASALATFQKKLAELKKLISPLEASLAKSKMAAKPFADKVQAAQKAAISVIARLKTARRKIMPIDMEYTKAVRQWKQDQTALNVLAKQIADIESHTTLNSLLVAISAAQKNQTKLSSQLATMKTTVASSRKNADTAAVNLKNLESKFAALKTEMANFQKQMETKQTIASQLTEAAKQAKLAAEKLPKDTDLAKSAALLKSKAQKYAQSTETASKEFSRKQSALKTLSSELASARTAHEKASTTWRTHQADLKNLEQSLAKLKSKTAMLAASVNETRDKLVKQLSNRFAVRPLQPLTPEQMAWSMMKATGYVDRIRLSEVAVHKKKNPKFVLPSDPAKRMAYEQTIERAVAKKLQSQVNLFVRLFGAAAGQPQDEFFATVDQALFLSNGSSVRSWLSPSGENLTARLLKLKDSKAIADELYISILSRKPTDSEIQDVGKYLLSREKDRQNALQELAWGLLTSAEFRFNH